MASQALLSAVMVLVLMMGVTGCRHKKELSGTFTGIAVSGLSFDTATLSGKTDAQGAFSYRKHEKVTFAIGDLVLGTTVGKKEVSPIDLVKGAADGSNQAVNNICVLLQSLDQDGSLNNGIQISDEIAAIVGKHQVDFNQDTEAFASSEAVTALLAELNAAGVFNDTDPRDRTLQEALAARELLARSLSERNTVETTDGAVKGYAADNTTWQYLGIPYAKPPLGQLRWRAPQPPEGWKGVREAVAWGDQAPQDIENQRHGEGGMSEDCLYLNVTAPKDASGLPVMVWFHGGAFSVLTGNTTAYNNVDALTRKDVILVTVTHRLGPFGYLSHPLLNAEFKEDFKDNFQDENEEAYGASGNYGQMDLVAALEWVQTNIAAFGGNPGNVTIFGQSGGGGKVALLMASQMAEGLFHKAIVMSGSSVPDPTQRTLEENIQRGYYAGLGLFNRIQATTLEEARALPWTAIIEADDAAGISRFSYWPNVDNRFLKDSSYNCIVNGLPNDVPLLIGAVSGDSEGQAPGLIANAKLRRQYGNTDTDIYAYKFSQVPGGWAQKNLLCGHGVDLAYVFNDPTSLTKNYEFGNVLDPLTGAPLAIDGVDDYAFLTDAEKAAVFSTVGWTDEDDATAQLTMDIWADFAKSGNPGIVDWPAYTLENDTYAEIESAGVTVKTGLADAFPESENVKLLRHSLDQDGDLNNGIQITDDIIAVVNQHAINYNQPIEAFAADEVFTALFADLNAAGVFTDTDPGDRTLLSLEAYLAYQALAQGTRNQVETTYGTINGFEADENTWQYLGVPYAKPPVGDLRWRPPQPLAPWQGVRDALVWGDQAAQNPALQRYGEGGMSEDCLYLNVTAPKDAAGYPVMVWFHGGGFTALTSNSAGYNNPGGLPTKGVVQVSVNHRLGFFGYMAHPWLSDEAEADPDYGYHGSGNYGQMDLIAALNWVKDNIAAFGGDPDNVTIFGESGGGRKTLALMASPQAKGLFHKAISQSGTLRPDTRTLAEAEAEGLKLSDSLGVTTIDELRAMSWQDIVTAATAAGIVPYTNVDGYYLPHAESYYFETPEEDGGGFNDVPFIILVNTDDTPDPIMTWRDVFPWMTDHSSQPHYAVNFTKVPGGWASQGVPAYHACELSYMHNFPDSAVSHYQLGLVTDPTAVVAPGESEPRLPIGDLDGDGTPGLVIITRVDEDGNETLVEVVSDLDDVRLSAGWDETDDAVADTMMALWSNFAKTGDPSIPGVLDWTPYTTENDTYLKLGETMELKTGQASLFPSEPEPLLPVLFIHGTSGSASQFESQAQRFIANGYPPEYLATYEYSTAGDMPAAIFSGMAGAAQNAEINSAIDELLAVTGAGKVNLIGHSLGTMVSYNFLNVPENAARVAHYVDVDGRNSQEGEDMPTGRVPTLGLWARSSADAEQGADTRKIAGFFGENDYDWMQSHIERATSRESFEKMYEFFNGQAPLTVEIPVADSQVVTIEGRANIFPENVGADNTMLYIYEVDPDTGFRMTGEPVDEGWDIGIDGKWGPVEVVNGAAYEFVLVDDSAPAAEHHFYREPFYADNRFVRLNTGRPGEGLANLLTRSSGHTIVMISRDKEMWGDQGDDNDVLRINGGDTLLTPESAPFDHRLSSLFLSDEGDPQDTSLMRIEAVHQRAFISGIDFYIPAVWPLDEAYTSSIELISRDSGGVAQTISVPNWPSDRVRTVSVLFNDYVQ